MNWRIAVLVKVATLSVVLFCAVAFLGVSGFQVVKADGSAAMFSEQFDGSAVDNSVWRVEEQNLDLTGYPAWGGKIEVVDGCLSMSSYGSTFPFIQILQNPFPAEGDFAIQFNLTYTCIADRGAGLMFGNGTPAMGLGPFGTDIWRNRVFTLWASDKNSESQAMIYIELFNRFVYEMDYSGFKPSSPPHLYKLAYLEGVYHVYVDGEEVASVESDVRPTTIVVGSPPIPRLPLSPAEEASWAYWGWSSFQVDYIAMLQPSEISLSVGGSESPKLGKKVSLAGNLTSADGAPLSGITVDVLYSIPGLSTWYPLAAATTNAAGAFGIDWLPTANGEFRLKALWSGNADSLGCSVEKNVSILSDQSENAFLAESNSTLSSLSFNATAKEISFTVSGVSGTFGYVRFAIPKTLLPALEDFKVYMDGEEVNFTAAEEGDSYLLYFEYHHSTHEVVLRIPVLTTPELQSGVLLPLLGCLALVVITLKKKSRAFSH